MKQPRRLQSHITVLGNVLNQRPSERNELPDLKALITRSYLAKLCAVLSKPVNISRIFCLVYTSFFFFFPFSLSSLFSSLFPILIFLFLFDFFFRQPLIISFLLAHSKLFHTFSFICLSLYTTCFFLRILLDLLPLVLISITSSF